MCLLISQPKNKSVSEEHLKTAYENNNDGAGFCYADNGRIIINKFRSFKKFYNQYETATKKHGATSDFIIHFRMSTHGTNKGVENVHPFKVNNELAFAHNGIISGVGDSKRLSDTQLFNKKVLKNLPNDFIKNSIIQVLIGDWIGNSKLVFLDNAGESFIVNKSMGHRDELGVWFSNESYECDLYAMNYGYNYYGGFHKPKINKTKRYKAGKQLTLTHNADELKMACSWCECVSADVKYHTSYGEQIPLCTTCAKYSNY